MSQPRYYRGGPSLAPRPADVAIDPRTDLLRPDHGVSVESTPAGLERFGGAYEVTNIPANLRVIQRGRRATHQEIVPAYPMTQTEYEQALGQIVLVPASDMGDGHDSTT